MDKKQMLPLLDAQVDAYREHRPVTAEMDISIFRAFCAGKSVVRIALDTPCAKSTVYRSIRRVKDFLEIAGQSSFMEVLRWHIAENAPNYGDLDAHSILEMLYVAYAESNHIGSVHASTGFTSLQSLLNGLSERQLDAVFDEVCDLCLSHERKGFTEGLKVGVRLADELSA